MAARKRIQVPVTADLEEYLALWAHMRNESSLPNWMKQVLTLRVDANREKINQGIEERAKLAGMTLEEYKASVFNEYGIDTSRRRQERDEYVIEVPDFSDIEES